ncbi:MAG: ATP-dependent RecD-like DNA helicase, partial [Planctomycetes bacterium]|nr:ATP-dependent RecD-like DNA helicase [Planctomycetota bacterium]
ASPERDYVVAELLARDGVRHTVAGSLAGCAIGDTVRCSAVPFDHPRFGRQLRIVALRWLPPSTELGLRRFLAGGSVEGIGEVLAGRIVDAFGLETMRILDEAPQRLSEIAGLGKKRIAAIAAAWQRSRAQNEEKAFLAGLGLGPATAEKVRAAFGDDVAERLRADPWQLAQLVDGIGFRRADEIAQRLDVPADATARLDAGLVHVLQEAADEGHCYLPRATLVQHAQALLSLPAGPIEDRVAALLPQGTLVADPLEGDMALFLPRLRAAEIEVATAVQRRLRAVEGKGAIDAARALKWVGPQLSIALTPDQAAALSLLFNQQFGVLTGGPGVGKTTIVRALATILERKGLRVALAAPTGRAARRLSDAAGRPAQTLHRLLEFEPHRHRFARNREQPLEVDALIVDEASMVDLLLMRDLLRALPAGARLLLVGDADQLPSVGPGDVLRSLVECGRVPVARLTQILRQREGSSIVRAAHAVGRGELPEFAREGEEGAFFVVRDDALAAQRTIVELAATRLPKKLGLDPKRAVQVLTPMNRGPLGVTALNQQLRATLNPAAGEELCVGDRVIQTRNDYDLDVMNGEIGQVVERDATSGDLTVDFDDRVVRFPGRSTGSLQPSWAITVHKSQGCEFEVVVLGLAMQHFVLLRRNLLYTAITRAKRVLVVVGSQRALQTAIELGHAERRMSLLERRLREGSGA